jgi:hypothetical protein
LGLSAEGKRWERADLAAEPTEERGERAAVLARLRRRKWPSGPKEWEEGGNPFIFLFQFSKAIFQNILNALLYLKKTTQYKNPMQ